VRARRIFSTAKRPAARLLLLALAEELEQLDEEVNDVEIERGRGKDVLLRRDFLHDHAHVVDDVQREQHSASAGQTHVNQSVLQPDLPQTHIGKTITARQNQKKLEQKTRGHSGERIPSRHAQIDTASIDACQHTKESCGVAVLCIIS